MVEAELRLASGGARVRSDERFCQVALGAPPLRVAMGPWRPLTSLKPSHMRLKTGELFFVFLEKCVFFVPRNIFSNVQNLFPKLAFNYEK